MSPVLPKAFADPDEVFRDLTALASCYRADHVRLLGGEPLLHPQLPAVISAVRASDVAERIRIVTNGLLLARAPESVWEAVDEIHVSEYPGFELSAPDLADCLSKAADARVDLEIKRFASFRESYSEYGTPDDALVEQIYSTCQIAHVWRCHNVYRGYFFKCPQAIFVNKLIGRHHGTDGVQLDGPSLRDRLEEYLSDTKPLASCRNCLGSVGRLYGHEQVRRGEWRAAQNAPTENLADRRYIETLRDAAGSDNGCATTTLRVDGH